jgi:hypothetical protein
MYKQIIAAALGFIALPALAGTQTWNLNSGSINFNGNGNQMSVSGADSNDLGITGWSDTAGSSDNLIRNGNLSYHPDFGLMLQNRDEGTSAPSHSIDNFGNDYDMVLLSFDDAIDLQGFNIGWAQEGSSAARADITVAAYTGAGSFTFASSDTWLSLAGANWSTIGYYGNVAATGYQAVTTDVTSKYWLIGAYNPTFNSPGEALGVYDIGARDGFKLASITGQTFTPDTSTSVPEPGTLAILASGILGMVATRRRKIASL